MRVISNDIVDLYDIGLAFLIEFDSINRLFFVIDFKT